jgi:hypothetical protein
MPLILSIIIALTLLGAPAWAQQPTSDTDKASSDISEAITGEDDLVKAKSKFKETWINPDADFTQYSKLYLWGAVFEFRDVGPARSSRSRMSTGGKSEFGISDADRTKFQATVSEAFTMEMERSKRFKIVDEISPDTLIVRGSVLDIVSNVPPELTGRSDVYLSNIGEATMVIDLIDAETGIIQARVSERRKIQPPGGGRIDTFSTPTNSVTVTADVKRWARSSASRLRKELEKAQKGH